MSYIKRFLEWLEAEKNMTSLQFDASDMSDKERLTDEWKRCENIKYPEPK